jgi:hypothetical protein
MNAKLAERTHLRRSAALAPAGRLWICHLTTTGMLCE